MGGEVAQRAPEAEDTAVLPIVSAAAIAAALARQPVPPLVEPAAPAGVVTPPWSPVGGEPPLLAVEAVGTNEAGAPASFDLAGFGEVEGAEAPFETTSIADLARAHEEANVEQAIAKDLTKRAERRRLIIIVAVLALLGGSLGTAGGAYFVSRERLGGGVAPKIGLSGGINSPTAVIPTSTPATTAPSAATTPTGAQVAVVILGLGDGSNDTSSHLGKFAEQRLPLTYGIYPQRAGTTKDAAVVQASGGQAMLYQPVGGAGSTAGSDRGVIDSGMTRRDIANTITRNIGQIASNVGIAPFGSSRGRYEARPTLILDVLALRQNVMVFSELEGTTTAIASSAKSLGVKTLKTDVALDTRADEKSFRRKWSDALRLAEKNGRVVVTTHLTGLSSRVLPSLLAAIDTNKYTLTLASSLAK